MPQEEMPPDTLTISINADCCLSLVPVRGGEFLMGSGDYPNESPAHRVRVSDFYISACPVTQQLYKTVTGDNPSQFKGWTRPVEQVSWHDAQQFIARLRHRTGREFRLPTDAEWEYAARGGEKSRGYSFAGSDRLEEVGWFDENSYGESKAVAQKLANELGIFDMSGNVWEWCGDWFDRNYYEECASRGVSVDPQGPDKGGFRVQRGGDWFGDAMGCRSAYRGYSHPDDRVSGIGFRLVLPCQSVGGRPLSREQGGD